MIPIKQIASLIFVILFISCKKSGCNFVSNIIVNKTLTLEKSLIVSKAQGWVYEEGGRCGLILYNNGDRVLAFDRCASEDSYLNNKLEVEGMEAVDPLSGARWLLYDGSPTYLAECPLYQYRVMKSGNLYVISN
ncbi:hypothetical protein [Sphingobacterium thermophilum]|uniref:Rieske domain-containing protein n=1 Tax=Sphingobacterium thermophilum TaxID=768534 RepID=A0ABP8R6Y6_9SPHI